MDYIIAFGQVKRYLAEAGERSFQNKSRVFRVLSEDYTLTAEGSARSRQSDGRRDASPQDLETPRSKRNPTTEANRTRSRIASELIEAIKGNPGVTQSALFLIVRGTNASKRVELERLVSCGLVIRRQRGRARSYTTVLRDQRSLMDRVEELETANALLLDKWARQECSWCGTKQSLGPSAP